MTFNVLTWEGVLMPEVQEPIRTLTLHWSYDYIPSNKLRNISFYFGNLCHVWPPSNKHRTCGAKNWKTAAALIRVDTVSKIKKKKRNKRPVNNNQNPARAHEVTKKYHRIPP